MIVGIVSSDGRVRSMTVSCLSGPSNSYRSGQTLHAPRAVYMGTAMTYSLFCISAVFFPT